MRLERRPHVPLHLVFIAPLAAVAVALILAGGLIAHWVGQGGTEKQQTKRKDKGTLMASGFVAGGAIMGVLAAGINFLGMKFIGEDWSLMGMLHLEHWAEESMGGELLGFIMFLCLCAYMIWYSKRVKQE